MKRFSFVLTVLTFPCVLWGSSAHADPPPAGTSSMYSQTCTAHFDDSARNLDCWASEDDARRALSSPDPMKRVAGFRVLKFLMGTQVKEEPLLFHALQNEQNPEAVGFMADFILGQETDGLFLPALHSILLDNRLGFEAVQKVLNAVARIRDPSSIQVLANVLEKAKWTGASHGLSIHQFSDTLAVFHHPATLPILRKLAAANDPTHPGYTYARELLSAFRILGDPGATDIVLSVLQSDHKEPWHESGAINALASMKAAWTAGYIHPYLSPQKEYYVRNAAARALGKLRNPVSSAFLVHAVQTDSDREVRIEAILSLGQLKSLDAVEPLGGVLQKDSHHLVRQASAQALGVIGGSRSKEILKSALSSEKNEMVLSAIRVSLELIR